MKVVTRIAVLIGSQSRFGKFLPGVRHDLKRMRDFLLSQNGGAWREDEIIRIENPTGQQVIALMGRLVADYIFVYFAGHGYTEEPDYRMLALTDEYIQDLLLLNRNPCQLLVIDACRDYRKPGAAISGIPREWQEWKGAYGLSVSRKLFDQYIADSPPGTKILHGTADGHTAFEDGRRKGGRFTLAILDTVFMMQEKKEYTPVFVNRLIQETSSLLDRGIEQQVPSIVHETGHLRVPFAITSPEFIPICPQQQPPKILQNNSALENLFLLAGVGLAMYAISQIE